MCSEVGEANQLLFSRLKRLIWSRWAFFLKRRSIVVVVLKLTELCSINEQPIPVWTTMNEVCGNYMKQYLETKVWCLMERFIVSYFASQNARILQIEIYTLCKCYLYCPIEIYCCVSHGLVELNWLWKVDVKSFIYLFHCSFGHS